MAKKLCPLINEKCRKKKCEFYLDCHCHYGGQHKHCCFQIIATNLLDALFCYEEHPEH